jgi:hypothetical protein
MMDMWNMIVEFISGEWILTKSRRANGGDIILLRSFLVSLFLYLTLLALKNLIDPTRSFQVDLIDFRTQLIDSSPLFGTLFGAVYIALYTRFASQWTYLAELYNKIKESEAAINSADGKDVIAAWKAGFLEDAAELHLATKGLFVSIIHSWGTQSEVEKKFVENTPGGRNRFDALMTDVKKAYGKHVSKFL